MSLEDSTNLRTLQEAVLSALELMDSGRIKMAKDILEAALGAKARPAEAV